MINLSLNELKLIAKKRSVKVYKNESKCYLLKIYYNILFDNILFNKNQKQTFLKRK